ncbi:MAG TPA: ABC transporter ATP-binding protein [Acidimicrobiales bacterium]|nr:ABC transporter ATP-binding protein [Acidimicrobiales bacterium]
MIRVENLSVSYGAVTALRDVTFEAPTGKITTVIGANGAGKTTLLRTISGLVKPRQGSIRLGEFDLVGTATEDIARRGVAHVPEGRGVIEELTVEENLRLGALASKVDLAEGIARQFTQFPALESRRRNYAATLSGGERQMLAMARALIARPSVLLLDEPSLGLAPQVTADMMRTISELCTSEDLTVILVEQNAKSALRIAHDAVVLHIGRVAAFGTAGEVAADESLRRYYLGLVT